MVVSVSHRTSSTRQQHSDSAPSHGLARRGRLLVLIIYLAFFVVISRLFYWQVVAGNSLRAVALEQYQHSTQLKGERGSIFTAEGNLLVGNEDVFRLFVQPPQLNQPADAVVNTLLPILSSELVPEEIASDSAASTAFLEQLKAQWLTKLQQPNAKWVALVPRLTKERKAQLESLQIKGMGFEPYQVRFYPEASLAAHVTGFVGKDNEGESVGYFGVEGALDKELQGVQTVTQVFKNALGWQLAGNHQSLSAQTHAGRDITLTIRRDLQAMVERSLQKGMERYGAKAGEVIVMEPSTGRILALASFPQYDQATFSEYPPETYKNQSVAAMYEPGSTFKLLTVAAGIDSGVITPDTRCTSCASARRIASYTIKTWNDQYHPDITMTDALAKSDNTAMMFITDLLGKDTFVEYLKKFGIGERLYLDVQEDTTTPFPSKWGPVELATASFGQGIGATSLQMVRAVSTIANAGVMMRPQIVQAVSDPTTGEKIEMQPVVERQVVKPETAEQLSQMMVIAASTGEAKWIASKTHTVAGKTGTSQIPINGAYDPDKTIASFIGFAPADAPRFVMLVKLVEPTSSIWAAETAAPLWYQIASQLYLMLEIPPNTM